MALDSVEGLEQPWAWFAEDPEERAWFSEPPNKELGLQCLKSIRQVNHEGFH
jgi:hypothetical protein